MVHIVKYKQYELINDSGTKQISEEFHVAYWYMSGYWEIPKRKLQIFLSFTSILRFLASARRSFPCLSHSKTAAAYGAGKTRADTGSTAVKQQQCTSHFEGVAYIRLLSDQ